MTSARAYAEETFGRAKLGDVRRTRRLVSMTRDAVLAPGGRITEVFRGAKRQAAYDFVEHDEIAADEIAAAMFDSTARACRRDDRVLVAVDGTSLTLRDHGKTKDFGPIGTHNKGARGLKVMNALALTTQGIPIGVADQVWWVRGAKARSGYRPAAERESARWREVVDHTVERFGAIAPQTALHFLLDREGDAALTIHKLLESGHEFTVRANGTRNALVGSKRKRVREALARSRPVAQMAVDMPARGGRPARTAELDVRAARMPLVLRDKHIGYPRVVELTVVWARESRSRRKDRLDWLLYTGLEVRTAQDACEAVRRYTLRWRIEDMHRAWKTGVCRVEDTQLRTAHAVIKWATILAAVATRAERLKHLSRKHPEMPATVELTTDEIDALALLRQQDGFAPASTEGLSLETATRWIADLGGYVGGRRSRPPGAVTIGRGLERMAAAAELLGQLRAAGRMR